MVSTSGDYSGLRAVAERSGAGHPAEFRALEEAARLGASHVYFRYFPNESRPPRPQVVIFDCTEQFEEGNAADKIRLLWNAGTAPLAFVFRNDKVDILTALKEPKLKGADYVPSYKDSAIATIRLAATVSSELERSKLARFSATAFDNGSFWDAPENQPLVATSRTALQSMLKSLRELRSEAKKQGFDQRAVNRLLILCLMIKFLEDRGAVSADFFGECSPGATEFFEVLGNKPGFLKCIDDLAKRFNGDVFRLTDAERSAIEATDLSSFAAFVEGKTYQKQRHFWKLFSFAHLPVELISYLYEDFIEPVDENGRSQRGTVYTPQHLVDLIVEEAMPMSRLREADGSFKVLDPGCGSGVFLVSAYERLVDAWRLQHGWKRPPADTLRKLLRENIFGIDIEPQAVELTVFSLCLTICGQMDPKRIWTTLKFDALRGKNIVESDFFEVIQLGTHEGRFDLVLGNPPFGSSVKDGPALAVEIANRGDYPELPDDQICYLFLREAPRVLKEGGKGYLILKDGFLYNLKTEKFRTQFLQAWHVPHILDFVSIRGLFCGQSRQKPADVKVIAVAFEKKQPDFSQPLLHVTFRRTAEVLGQIGFELDAYDLHWIPRDLACEDPVVWKANLLGGGRLLNVFRKYSEIPTLGDFLKRMKKEHGWVYAEGVIRGNQSKSAEHLYGRLYLPPEGLTVDGIVEETLEPFDEKFLERPREHLLFTGAQLLIREHESLPSALTYERLLFGHEILGIAADRHDPFLFLLSEYLKRHRTDLAFFTRFGSRYLVGRQSALLAAEVLSIPVGSEFEPPKFLPSERLLADELEEYQIPHIKYGLDPEKSPGARDATRKQVDSYAETYVRELKPIYTPLHALEPIEFSNAWCVPFCFGGKPNREIGNPDELHGLLDALLVSSGRGRLRIQRIVRLFHGNLLFFIKPKALRFWLRSIALRDADDTFAEIRRGDLQQRAHKVTRLKRRHA